MTEELSEQIAENRARAEMYRLLASVFFRELDESQIATLKAAPLAAPEEGPMPGSSWRPASTRAVPPSPSSRCSPARRESSWTRRASR